MRKYIVNAHRTGSDAFDELHQELKPLVIECLNVSPLESKAKYILSKEKQLLFSLVKKWRGNHPRHTFFPDEKPNPALDLFK